MKLTLRTVNWWRNLVNPCGGFSIFDRCDVSFLSLSTGQMGKARRHRQGFWHCRGHQPSDTGHHLAMYLQLQEQLSDWWVRQFFCQYLSADREEFLTRFSQCNTDLAFLWGKSFFFFFFLFPEIVCVIRFKVDVKFLDEGFFCSVWFYFSSCVGQSGGDFLWIIGISRCFHFQRNRWLRQSRLYDDRHDQRAAHQLPLPQQPHLQHLSRPQVQKGISNNSHQNRYDSVVTF